MKNWIWWLIGGILSIIGGLFALANPYAGSIAVELLAGWNFLIVGIVVFVAAISEKGWDGRGWAIVWGIIAVILGISLLAHPLAGLLSLTMAAAIMMIASGIFQVIIAFNKELHEYRWMIVISGAISILLGIMIISNFPASAAVYFGIYLGVQLLMGGVWLIAFALKRRSMGI